MRELIMHHLVSKLCGVHVTVGIRQENNGEGEV